MQADLYALPVIRDVADTLARECCETFLRHFGRVKSDDSSFKIYMSIIATAEETSTSQEGVARYLVEQGLRAPRDAFPTGFVGYLDKRRHKTVWEPDAPTAQQRELAQIWERDRITETRVTGTKRRRNASRAQLFGEDTPQTL